MIRWITTHWRWFDPAASWCDMGRCYERCCECWEKAMAALEGLALLGAEVVEATAAIIKSNDALEQSLEELMRTGVNAYLVDAGEVYVCQEDMGELGSIYGNERVIDIIFAKTRGQAQYKFWRRYAEALGELTENTYKTRLLRKNVPNESPALLHELWEACAVDAQGGS